jgi:hypothetical protein
MGSSGKKKTTMAKLMRESRLRERRLDKQARKDARKAAAAEGSTPIAQPLGADGEPAGADAAAQPEAEPVGPNAAATLEAEPAGPDAAAQPEAEPIARTSPPARP